MLAAIEWPHGHIDRAIEFSQQGLQADDGSFDLNTRIQLLSRLGGILTEKGHFTEGRDILRAARYLLAMDRKLERFGLAVIGKVGICANLARSYAEIGESDEAIAAEIEAVEAAENSSHNFSRLFAYEHMGWSCLLLDKPETALSYLTLAHDLCEITKSKLHKAFLLGAIAYAHALSGDVESSMQLFSQAFLFAQQERACAYLNQVHLWCGETCLLTGDPQNARQYARLVQASTEKTGRIGYSIKAMALDAQAAFIFKRGDRRSAESLKRAEQSALSLSMNRLAARCARLRDCEIIDDYCQSIRNNSNIKAF